MSNELIPTSATFNQLGSISQDWTIEAMLEENEKRMEKMNEVFDPFTGLNSLGERQLVEIPNFPIVQQYLPINMMNNPFMQELATWGVDAFISRNFRGADYNVARNAVMDMYRRVRNKYDFAWWCWMYVPISRKGGGDDIRFRLNLPQRKYMSMWEEMESQKLPVRIDMLKARQWGGSTVTEIKIGHKQLVETLGANSIIVGHVKDASTEVKDMYFRLINKYPTELLYSPTAKYNPKIPPIHGTSSSANLFYVDSRKCKIKLGSAERPESARGGDSTLAHCTEVAMWVATEGKTPEDIVRSVTGGISYIPNTAIIYESTANGTDNFFHDEYIAAKEAKQNGKFHQFWNLFVSWDEIGWKNMLPFKGDEKYLKCNCPYKEGSSRFDMYLPDHIGSTAPTAREFAEMLLANKDQREAENDRVEPGRYLWWLWIKGVPLQGIYWYTLERTKFHDHADMAAEAPSDDIEAFKHSGAKVFSEYYIHNLLPSCKNPKYIGEIESTITVSAEDFKKFKHRPNDAFSGKQKLSNLQFYEDKQGSLFIWEMPEYFPDVKVKNRYLAVVDIGGMSSRADYSVVVIFDRYWMLEGGKPSVVAQWYGHIDHDVLAWKAAQIAKFYDNALLVIESNTLETRDRDRDVDGDQSSFILNQIKEAYPNLYERTSKEEVIRDGIPHAYGFHTNQSTKPMIIANLVKILREGLYVERDRRCLDEYMVYEKKPNGSFGAASKHHDDLLMTRAIGLHICFNEMEYPKVIELKKQKTITKGQTEISAAII